MAVDLSELPSPFYRVSLKATVFDEQWRLLVVQTPDGLWEMPGGGWEHGESIELCFRREFKEELGVSSLKIGAPLFVYRGQNPRGFFAARIVYEVILDAHRVRPGSDMIAARFVTKEQLLALPMAADEEPIKTYIDQIWPTAVADGQPLNVIRPPIEKNAAHL